MEKITNKHTATISQTTRENTLRYNMFILHEILGITKKQTAWSLISQNVRERVIRKGVLDETKAVGAAEATGMDEGCFTGKARFRIPYCEAIIEKNLDAVRDYTTELHNICSELVRTVEAFKRREYIEDENLERFIHYCINGFTMQGYRRSIQAKPDICKAIGAIDKYDIKEADNKTLERFIELLIEKEKLARAVLTFREYEIDD